MKKYLGFIVLTGLMIASFALAEDTDTTKPTPTLYGSEMREVRSDFRQTMSDERQAFMEKMKAEREAFLKELRTKKEEFRKANTLRKNEFCEKAKRAIGQRFGMSIKALGTIQDRVEAIIVKLAREGEDTQLAKEALEKSRQKSEEAKIKLSSVRTGLPADCSKLTPEDYEKIKTATREARDLLKESREYLRDAIDAIKNLKTEKEEDNENNEGDNSQN
jgi:hypothetical protein